MSDVFNKGLGDLKMADFAGELPTLPKIQQPSSLDLLREAGVVGQTGTNRRRTSIDIAGEMIKMQKQKQQLEKLQAASAGPATIPSWDTAMAGIAGFEGLPYEDKKTLYDTYVQDAVKAMQLTDTKTNPALLEQQVRDQSTAPIDPTGGKGTVGRAISSGISNTKAAATGMLGYALAKFGDDKNAKDMFAAMSKYTKDAQDMGKPNDMLSEALKPDGSLFDWALFNISQQIPNLVESLVFATGGAVIGGASTGGAGTLPSAALGFVGKSVLKKEFVRKAARYEAQQMTKNIAAGMGRQEALLLAQTQLRQNLQKSVGKTVGAVTAMMAASEARGVGEIAQNAQAEGIDPGTLDALSVASGATAYALLETFSDKLLLGSFTKGAAGGLVKRTLKKGAAIGTTEGLTEVGQDYATALAAGVDTPSALDSFNAFGAGFVGGAAVGGGGAALRGDTSKANTNAPPLAEQDTPLDPDAPADTSVVPPGTTQELDGATVVMGANGVWEYAEDSEKSDLADTFIKLSGEDAAARAQANADQLVEPEFDDEQMAPEEELSAIDLLEGRLADANAAIESGREGAYDEARALFDGATNAELQAVETMAPGGAATQLAQLFGQQDRLFDPYANEDTTGEFDAEGDLVVGETRGPDAAPAIGTTLRDMYGEMLNSVRGLSDRQLPNDLGNDLYARVRGLTGIDARDQMLISEAILNGQVDDQLGRVMMTAINNAEASGFTERANAQLPAPPAEVTIETPVPRGTPGRPGSASFPLRQLYQRLLESAANNGGVVEPSVAQAASLALETLPGLTADERRVLGSTVRQGALNASLERDLWSTIDRIDAAAPTAGTGGMRVTPGQALPYGTIVEETPRDEALLPTPENIARLANYSSSSPVQREDNLRWFFQPGSIITNRNSNGRYVVIENTGTSIGGSFANVQQVDQDNRTMSESTQRYAIAPNIGELLASFPASAGAPTALAPTAAARPTGVDNTTALPPTNDNTIDPDSLESAPTSLVNYARERGSELTRGIQRGRYVGVLVPENSTLAERTEHFVQALQEAMGMYGFDVSIASSGQRNFSVTFPGGGSASGYLMFNGTNTQVYTNTTQIAYSAGYGTADSHGGRYYDALNGAIVSARLLAYNSGGGLSDVNKLRMPVNRLRGMLKWGVITGEFNNAVRSLAMPEGRGLASLEAYKNLLAKVKRNVQNLYPNVKLTPDGSGITYGSSAQERTVSMEELRAEAMAVTRPSIQQKAASPDAVMLIALYNTISSRRAPTTRGRVVRRALRNPNFGRLFSLDASSIADGTAANPATTVEQNPRQVQVQARLRRLQADYRSGKLTAEEFVFGVSELAEEMNQASMERKHKRFSRDRVRGADHVMAKLLTARRQGLLSDEAVSFALWLLNQNTGLANDLGVSIKGDLKRDGSAGFYTPGSRVMTLMASQNNPTTTVHEILHHTERMMPADVQQGIKDAYNRQVEAAVKNMTLEQQMALTDLIMGAAGDQKAWARAMTAFSKGVLNYDDHYQLANPSEYWAVNGTDILAGRFDAAQGSWIAKAKQWLSEFVQRLKRVVGMRNHTAVLNALDAVLNGTGERMSPKMLAEAAGRMYDIDTDTDNATAAEVDVDNDSRPQRRTATSTLSQNMRNGVPASAATPTRGVVQAAKAKDRAGVERALRSFGEKINEELHDATARMKRWLQFLPEGEGGITPLLKQRVIGSMYTARKVRNELLRRANDTYVRDIDKAIAKFAKDRGVSLETAQRDIGYAITATYVPEANAKLIAQRAQEIRALQAQIKEAEANEGAEVEDFVIGDMVDEAQDAAETAPEGETSLEDLKAQLSVMQRNFVALVNAVNSTSLTVAKHGGGGVAGMNNAQAADMLAGIRAQHGEAGMNQIRAIAAKLYDLNSWKLALDIETGKVNPEVAAAFVGKPDIVEELRTLRELANRSNAENKASVDAVERQRVKVMRLVRSNYVPLSGDPTRDIDDASFHGGSGIPNVQQDYRLKGRERGTPPDDALSTSRAALMKSASYAGWRDFQDGIAEIHGKLSKENRKDYGIRAESIPKNRSTLSNKAVIRARNGKATAYIFEDEKLIDAIRGANRLENNFLLEGAGKVTKFYSYMATQANPFFAPFNFLRDSWERSENMRSRNYLTATGAKVDSGSLSNATLRYLASPELFQATARHAFGKAVDTSSRMGRYLDEFLRQGGVSTFSSQFSADRAKMIAAVSKQKSWRQQLSTLGRFIEGYNKTLDVGPALATYVAMRDAGMSTKDAAAGSLDLMDFGKRGNSANVFGALYAFAQPTFTGAANAITSLRDPVSGKWSKTGVTRFAAYSIGFLMLQAFMRSLADDDEGGNKLDQQSPFMKNNFLLVPYGDNGMIKVPLAYGLTRVANGIARAALGASTDEQTPTEALGKLVSGSVVPVFSPIEDSDIDWGERPLQAFLTLLAPSWLKPPLALATNVTPFDTKIVNDKYADPKKFKSEQFGKYAPEEYRDIARVLRTTFGIDMAPEEVRYLIRSYPTGAAQLAINGMIEKPEEGFTGAAANKFYTNYSEFARYFQFKKALDETDDLMKKVNAGETITNEMDRKKLLWRAAWDEQDKGLKKEKAAATRQSKKISLTKETKDAIDGQFGDVRMAAQVRALYRYRLLQGKNATVGEP